MNIYPIIFSTEMVKAILQSHKTQTRRIVKMKDGGLMEDDDLSNHLDGSFEYVKDFTKTFPFWQELECPYGKIGDILWVKETYQKVSTFPEPDCFGLYLYKSMGDTPDKWLPSIFMPKKAARLFLKITDIKVERLQEISPHDAVEEGINYWNIDKDAFEGGELMADYENYMWRDDEKYEDYWFPVYADPISSYMSLWEKINGKESLKANPFVWVIEFERTERPNDFIKMEVHAETA